MIIFRKANQVQSLVGVFQGLWEVSFFRVTNHQVHSSPHIISEAFLWKHKNRKSGFHAFSPTAHSSLRCMKPEFFEVPNKNMCLWIVDTTCSMFLRYRKNIIGVLQLQVVVNHVCLGGFDVPGRYSSDSDDDWDFMIVFWLRCLRGFYDHLLLLTRNHHHTFFGKTKKKCTLTWNHHLHE